MKLPELAAFISDTHGDSENRKLILSLFRQFFKYCKKHGIKFVFHLGDFFIDRRGQGLVTLYLFSEVADLAQQYGITLHIIPGNHDKTDQTSHRSYLGIYNHPSVIVHDAEEPENSFVDDTANKIRYLLLPFFVDAVYYDKLAKLPLRNGWKNILLTHVGIDGVLNNRGEQEDHVIEIGSFRGFDLTLIGHYHNLNVVSKRIRYMSSSHQANFGEDEAKGFTTLNAALESVQHPLNSPKWRKVRLTTTNVKVILKNIEKYKPQYENLRFEFLCSEEEWASIDKDHLNTQGIQVSWVNSTGSRLNDAEAEELTSSAAFTPKEINKNFLHYCVQQKITSAQRRLGLELLKEHLNK